MQCPVLTYGLPLHLAIVRCYHEQNCDSTRSSLPPTQHWALTSSIPAVRSHLLRACRALTHLSLNDNALGDHGIELMSNSLWGCRQLEHLDLSGNFMQDEGGICSTVSMPFV